MVDCTFYKSTIKSNCILLCHACVRSSRQELFCKNSILRNFAKFTGKRLCLSLFFIKKKKFLRTSFLTENLRWLLLAFQSESTLYSFRTSCSKQVQCLKFQWIKTSWKYNRSNIVQTSFLFLFSLLCCRLLDSCNIAKKTLADSFNENILRQRGLDKYFYDRFLLVSTFPC